MKVEYTSKTSVFHSMYRGLLKYPQGLLVTVFLLVLTGFIISTWGLISGDIYVLEYSLKLFIVAISILVLLELHRDMSRVFELFFLTTLLIVLNYIVYIKLNNLVYAFIFLLHIVLITLWIQITTLLYSTLKKYVYLLTMLSTYIVTSHYIVVLHYSSYLLVYIALLISIIATLLYVLILRILDTIVSLYRNTTGDLFTRFTVFLRSISVLWISINKYINSFKKLVVKIVMFHRFNYTPYISKLILVLKYVSSWKYLDFKNFKYTIQYPSKKTMFKSIERSINIEKLLSGITGFYRGLEDRVIEGVKSRIVEGIEILHRVFEYSLVTNTLILGLLILLALVIYILLVT